jgi:hypothetical protein
VIERKRRDKIEDVEMKVPPVVEEFWPEKLRKLFRPKGGTPWRIIAKLQEKSKHRSLGLPTRFRGEIRSP